MTKAASAIEAAAFQRLTAGVTLATVFQHVPEDTPPPVVIVGDIDLEAFGTKGADPDRHGTLTVVTVVDGEARKPLLDIQEQVETALDGVTVALTGWSISFSFQASDGFLVPDAATEDNPDPGETYVGNSRFDVSAISN